MWFDTSHVPEPIQPRMQWGNGSCFPWLKAGGSEEPHLPPVSFSSSIGSIPWVGLDLPSPSAWRLKCVQLIPTLSQCHNVHKMEQPCYNFTCSRRHVVTCEYDRHLILLIYLPVTVTSSILLFIITRHTEKYYSTCLTRLSLFSSMH